MATTGIPAKDAVAKVLRDTTALPAFLTGSAVAAETYDLQQSYSDIDLFVPNEGSYFAVVTKLLCSGYRIENDRFERMWDRHVNIGFNKWHTNSMKLIDNATGTEVNVIYKLVEGHQTTQLSQVIESFDFGLLGVGYETKTGTFRDMRGYLFPGLDPNGPLPMIGYRAGTVGKGLMSQFIMQRTPGRYARYIEYGHDLSAVKDTLVEGYQIYADYKMNRSKDDDILIGKIALALSQKIEADDIAGLLLYDKKLPTTDGLDDVMAALE